jgi:RNA polymerase sigma-70 factor, ECF subfamily
LSTERLAALYEAHGVRLYRYALMILADAGAAEDAVHDAFCELSKAMARDQSLANPAYLTTMVRNGCYSALRHRRRVADGTAMLIEPQSADATIEERVMLDAALRELSAEQREVVFLKVFEGLTFHEIGERCGCSLNTAASRYRYALAALRRTLTLEGSRE